MRRKILSVAASNLTGAAFGFLTSILLARLLDVKEFGRTTFVTALVMLLYSAADFGFSNALVIYANKPSPFDQDERIAWVNAAYARFLAVAFPAALALLAAISRSYQLTWTELWVSFSSFALFTLYRYLTTIQQAKGQWRRFNLLLLANNAVKCLVVIGALGLCSLLLPEVGRYAVFLCGYAAYSVVLFLAALKTSKGAALRFITFPSSQAKDDFYRILYPIATAAIFILVSMRSDAMIIEKFLGSHALGIYGAANTMALAFPLITSSMMNVLIKESAGNPNSLGMLLSMQRRYFPLLMASFAAIFLLAPLVVPLCFGSAYRAAVPAFRILLIPFLGGVLFTPLESYFYAHKPKDIRMLKFLQMLVVVLGGIILVGPLRIEGVALAIALSRVGGWCYIYSRSRSELARLSKAGGAL